MRGTTVVALILLGVLVVVGGGAAIARQQSLASAVAQYHETNNSEASGAPQQTVVGTWSTREAVLSVGVLVTWTAVFLATCVSLAAWLIVWRLDALNTVLARALPGPTPPPLTEFPIAPTGSLRV